MAGPREIVLGVGVVLIGHGLKDGRPFVLIRPVAEPGPIGETPPEYSAEINHIDATEGDTIIWLDGPWTGLIDHMYQATEKMVADRLAKGGVNEA